MAELGVGYVSIVPEVSKITPNVAKALQGLDPVAERQGSSMGSKLASGVSTALKATAVGAGAVAGGLIATGITKGIGRLTAIDTAEGKLKGLGHTTQSTAAVMDSALASVRGTAYGLGDAATIASSAVAAGIKPGQELTKYLSMTADAAAIAGADLSEMGSIINQVQTGQIAYTDNLNQLADRGIPIYSWLAEEAGVAAGEVKKLASEGEISSEMFFNAIEKNIGGAAQSMGDTVQGAAANVGAALGRTGATAVEPFFNLFKDGAGVATRALDGINDYIKPFASATEQWLNGTAVPGLVAFKDTALETWQALRGSSEVQGLMAQTVGVVTDLVDAGRDLAPVMGQAVSAIADASAALGIGSWQIALVGLEGIGAAARLATPPLEMLTGIMQDHPSLVTAAVAAWAGFKTLPGIMDRINPVVSKVAEGVTTGATGVKLFGSSFIEAYGYVRQANPELGRAGAALTVIGGEGGVASAGLEKVKGAATGVLNAFGGPWAVGLAAAGLAITAVVQANQKASAAQDAMAASARAAADAQAELQGQVAGTTGALNDEAMAAAATIVKGQLSELVEMGEAYSGWIRKVDTDTNVWQRMFNIGGQWEEDKKKATETREEYDALKTVLKDTGEDFDSLNGIVAAGGPEYDDLINRLRASGDGGVRAAEGLEEARASIEQLIEEARALDPAVAAGAAAVQQLADAAGNADQRMAGLRSLLQAMGLLPKDAEEAMRDAAEAVDDLVARAGTLADQSGVLGDALIGMDGKLDTTTANGRALFDELSNLGEELMNVAANGGDVEGAFEAMKPAFQALADGFGLPIEQVMELSRGFGLLPRELRVGVALDGADESIAEIGTVWQAVQDLHVGDDPVRIMVDNEEAKQAIEDAGFALEAIEGTESSFLITAETDDAQGNLADVIIKMSEIDDLDVSPTVFLNDRELITSANNAQSLLDTLNVQEPTPEADLIIEKLVNGVDISQGELDFLAAQSPTPIADLQKGLLENGVKLSNEMLDALEKRKPITVIDADSKPLTDAAARARAELDKLPRDVFIRLRIQEWREYYDSGSAVSSGGTNYGQHYGATGGRYNPTAGFENLPGYQDGGRHGGYRLPSTGPGTDVTDGFLAVDRTGMPIARLDADEWVIRGESSEKYHRALGLINQDHPSVHHLAGYETGGRVGRPASQILAFAEGKEVDGHRASRSLEGAMYKWAGINWGDCSAAMAGLARFAAGLAPFAGRFSTGNQRQALSELGFRSGLGPASAFNIGWYHGYGPGGGHTSGTINGVNVEMGGARGDGQIGGRAAPATHPQYNQHAHLPLSSLDSSVRSSSGESGIASTSTSGLKLENGIQVNWGEATDFYESALKYLRQPTLFDTGGIMQHGQLGINLSGAPERVLSPLQTLSFDKALTVLPQSAEQMASAARTFLEATNRNVEISRAQAQEIGRDLGGDWLLRSQIVADAEQGLVDLRRQLSIETENITRAEHNLTQAQKELSRVQSEGVVLSESMSRRIEDAEASLAKARADGKPDKIATEEKKLARLREDAAKELATSSDKNAENVRRAMENVADAEQDLSDTRSENADAAMRLEAAERAIAAARFQAIADMAVSAGNTLAMGANHLSGFFDEMSRLTGIVENLRQEVSKLQMQQVTNQLNLQKAQHELHVSEWDYQRTLARGAIDRVEAERRVEEARKRAAVMGQTGIEAMSGAMDRFRTTGVFAVGELSESAIENSNLVKEALWGVRIVEGQNALAALDASWAQSQAQFAVAEATLASVQATEFLQLQTAALEGQARQLYGLTQNQATSASKGMGGIGGLLGGLGKVVGGALTGLAGFAAGGPLGAIPGAIMAISGIGESVRGGIDAWNNRGEVKQAWDSMGALEKVTLVGGGILGAGATGLGAYLGGAEGADMGSQLADAILGTTVGSLQYSITSRIEKQNRDYADRRSAMERDFAQRDASLQENRLVGQLDYLQQRDRIEADLKYAELMQQAAVSTSDELTEKILAAAEIEAARAGKASQEQLAEMRRSNDSLERLVELMEAANSPANQGQLSAVASGLGAMLRSLSTPGFTADDYVNARI